MRKFLIYRKNFLKFMYQKAYINWIRKKKKVNLYNGQGLTAVADVPCTT